MHPSKNIPALLLLSALLIHPLEAAVESYKIETNVLPQLSPVMLMQGVTEGKIVFAIDLDETGKLTDWLVLGYTHPGLVRNCVSALKTWKFHPAKIDGQPVPIQTELTINLTAEGAVISRPSDVPIDDYLRRIVGARMLPKPRSPRELDAVPALVTKTTPKYLKDAEKQGVHGNVKIHFYIDENGEVRMPSVEGEAHPYLAAEAIAAVREWRFTPPTAQGEPVTVAALQEFHFNSN